MADISKITLPDNSQYDIKVYTDHIAPMMSKTFTGVIGTAANWANATFFYGKILPTNWTDIYRLTYKVTVECAGRNDAKSVHICTLSGRANSLISYANWNSIISTSYRPIYMTVIYRAKEAGITNNYGHLLGTRLYSAWNYTTAANSRTVQIDIIRTENCSFEFFDEPVKYSGAPGTGSTNYDNYTDMNAADQGLQETGDANSYMHAGHIRYYSNLQAGEVLPVNSIVVIKSDGKAYKAEANKTFDIRYPVIWNDTAISNLTNYYYQYYYTQIYDRDLNTCYSGFTAIAGANIYLVITLNGTEATIDSTFLTENLPATDDGKVYIRIGRLAPNSTNGRSQFIFLQEKPMFWYKDGKVQLYAGASSYAANAGTVNGHTVAKDVPSNAVFTDTWRGIQDNLTSSSNTTESLSAKQGYLLANGSARDSTKVAKAGDTMTGNLIVPAERVANTYYGISFDRTTHTPVETILYTGIKWLSGRHMPVIHITGYAYGLNSPVEFKIGFYIYQDKIGYSGVTNMGAWSPNVFLFKYARNDVDYVAVGLAGSCYFLQLQADVQDEMGKFGSIVTDSSAWSWSFSTSTGIIPTADDGTTCIQVPYKANILNPSKVNGHTVESNVPVNAKFTDTTYDDATTSAHGLMTAAMVTKLNGIATGAEVNQNAYSNVTVGSTTISADAKTDTLTLVAGSNVTLTPDATNDKITIAATDTTYESKAAASGGTAVSLVTTGEKYTWNSKTSNTGTVTKVSTGVGLTGGDITTTGTVKAKLKSETASTLASAAMGTTANRQYAVGVDKDGYLSVNVPWAADTDTNVTNTLNNTAKAYLTGTTTATTNTGTQVFDNGIYTTTTAGQLNATTYKVNEKVTLQYDTTAECLNFVFS